MSNGYRRLGRGYIVLGVLTPEVPSADFDVPAGVVDADLLLIWDEEGSGTLGIYVGYESIAGTGTELVTLNGNIDSADGNQRIAMTAPFPSVIQAIRSGVGLAGSVSIAILPRIIQ